MTELKTDQFPIEQLRDVLHGVDNWQTLSPVDRAGYFAASFLLDTVEALAEHQANGHDVSTHLDKLEKLTKIIEQLQNTDANNEQIVRTEGEYHDAFRPKTTLEEIFKNNPPPKFD